ncbi:MAG: SOS response-associated peptidase [Dokdonella sp.]|uniref:SOS response-associated peptidase family protein n=1 Tax=Dokdonella sp. TaxID=2291710 RepID=UPI0025B9FE34|nr:SOS response-associated peptidase family protein [Dokdonella sp.]MBZ0223413.1 SOS response-associated peptidase [Dokdonella sp.]
MCYSAQIQADFRKYQREHGANMDLAAFARLYWQRDQGARLRIPKALDAAFAQPESAQERRIKAFIDAFDSRETQRIEQELFKQKKRLTDAQRTLAIKFTKVASESQRIAGNKIESALARLADLRRSTPLDRDARIFPGWYAPVLVREGGRRVLRPMRYQCRPAGKPANYDTRYPGTYNARRDNLEGFWRAQFGHSHALMIVHAFYENVARHAAEHRALAAGEQEQNIVLEFRPRPAHDMLVACLWSHWQGKDETLDSFAAITDAPPAEIAAAGHDRCIVPIKPQHIDAWLQPDATQLEALQAILDDRDRPYYEHRLAA